MIERCWFNRFNPDAEQCPEQDHRQVFQCVRQRSLTQRFTWTAV